MNTNGVTIVTTDDERKKFIDFPYQHYSDNDVWVPPLKMDQKKLIDTKKNPYFDNAEIALFIAEHNGEIAGRISAVVDHRYNEHHGTKTGHFGFFECIDNQETANLLFRVASDWLKDKGMKDVLGPASPGMMDTIGLLVDNFDKQPYLLMPYNKPYYEKLVKGAGFKDEMDLLAYYVNKENMDLSRFERAQDIIYRRYPTLNIRQINMKKLNEEVEIVRNIYNEAWKDNWGFLPLTYEELQHTAKDFKMILDPGFAHIAEIKGEPVAFSIALPDYNQVFKDMGGNLFPFGIFKFLFGKKKIDRLRTALLGVLPKYQGKGIDALLTEKALQTGIRKNLTQSEISWILGTNIQMIRLAEKIGGKLDKTYRMYRKELN